MIRRTCSRCDNEFPIKANRVPALSTGVKRGAKRPEHGVLRGAWAGEWRCNQWSPCGETASSVVNKRRLGHTQKKPDVANRPKEGQAYGCPVPRSVRCGERLVAFQNLNVCDGLSGRVVGTCHLDRGTTSPGASRSASALRGGGRRLSVWPYCLARRSSSSARRAMARASSWGATSARSTARAASLG